MPAKTDRVYGDTSFTSLPPELIDAAKNLARRRNVYLYELFGEAINDIDSRIKAGEKIDWPVVRRGSAGRGYHTRLEIQTLERLREGAARSEVNANIFFMAALRDYVRRHSLETHI